MTFRRVFTLLSFPLVALLGFAGGAAWKGASNAMTPATSEVPNEIRDKEAEAVQKRERQEKKRVMLAFPTVVQLVSNPRNVLISPYQDGLMKVRCKGMEGDFSREFIAVFRCKEKGAPTAAAQLQRGMRLNIKMTESDTVPPELKGMATADEVDDFTLPVYWVQSYSHNEARLRIADNPGRLKFVDQLSDSVVKAPVSIQAGDAKVPFYFYGGDWAIYRPGVEEQFAASKEGAVRSSVLRIDKLLRKNGGRLIFVPVPQSASLYPDLALGRNDGRVLKGPPGNTAVQELLRTLKGDGVSVVDLTEHFKSHRTYDFEGKEYPAWLPNDTHWSSWAAAESAKLVKAEVTRALKESSSIPGVDGNLAASVKEVRMDHAGDMGNLEVVKSLGVHVDPVPTVLYPCNALAEAQAEVDPSASVHVIGDSYAIIWESARAGFSSHLSNLLHQPVYTMAVSGSGNRGAPHQWLKHAGDGHPRVLIWLVAERTLAQSDWFELPQTNGGD